MSLPPVEIPLGAMRFNSDSQKLEYWNGSEWRQFNTFSPDLDGGSRGLIMGGYYSSPGPGSTHNVIEYITIPTRGDAADFADLTVTTRDNSSAASRTRGLSMGRADNDDTISYVTFASKGTNAVDFGNLITSRRGCEGVSNETRALCAGGNNDGGTHYNVIEYVTIAETSNAVDFGDLTTTKTRSAGASSPTRGVFMTGSPGVTNNIDFVNIASIGNAQDFGDTEQLGGNSSAVASATRMVAASSNKTMASIQFATKGESIDWGFMLVERSSFAAMSDSVRGVWAGGDGSPAQFREMDYFQISSGGLCHDFDNLAYPNQQTSGCSNGHGGLG